MRGLSLSLSVLVFCATHALAQENVIVTEQAMRSGDPTQVVCKMGAPTIGSRLGAKKTCHPVGTWKQLQANGQYDIERMQTRSENEYWFPH